MILQEWLSIKILEALDDRGGNVEAKELAENLGEDVSEIAYVCAALHGGGLLKFEQVAMYGGDSPKLGSPDAEYALTSTGQQRANQLKFNRQALEGQAIRSALLRAAYQMGEEKTLFQGSELVPLIEKLGVDTKRINLALRRLIDEGLLKAIGGSRDGPVLGHVLQITSAGYTVAEMGEKSKETVQYIDQSHSTVFGNIQAENFAAATGHGSNASVQVSGIDAEAFATTLAETQAAIMDIRNIEQQIYLEGVLKRFANAVEQGDKEQATSMGEKFVEFLKTGKESVENTQVLYGFIVALAAQAGFELPSLPTS